MYTDQTMNKSEVQAKFNKNKDFNLGWICPKCGRVLSPKEKSCPCTKAKQENVQSKSNWIHD